MDEYKITGTNGWHTFTGTASQCISDCISYAGKIKGGTKELATSELERRGCVVIATQSKVFTVTKVGTV